MSGFLDELNAIGRIFNKLNSMQKADLSQVQIEAINKLGQSISDYWRICFDSYVQDDLMRHPGAKREEMFTCGKRN